MAGTGRPSLVWCAEALAGEEAGERTRGSADPALGLGWVIFGMGGESAEEVSSPCPSLVVLPVSGLCSQQM